MQAEVAPEPSASGRVRVRLSYIWVSSVLILSARWRDKHKQLRKQLKRGNIDNKSRIEAHFDLKFG